MLVFFSVSWGTEVIRKDAKTFAAITAQFNPLLPITNR